MSASSDPAGSLLPGATVLLLWLGSIAVAWRARHRALLSLQATSAVALVLVIACVNLVSLLLVHLDVRRAELALRAALGAGRVRLARQVVLESALLSLSGGLLGLALSVPAIEWLLTFAPRGLPLAHRVGLSGGVAAAGLAVALLCGTLIGVIAAGRIEAGPGRMLLAATPRTVAGSRSSRRLHGMLVGTEVALSLMLLIAATLLLRSFAGLRATDAGFRADDVCAGRHGRRGSSGRSER